MIARYALNKVTVCLAIVLFSVFAPFAANGQQTSGTEAAETEKAERMELEEVVVTARLREESLQDIPLAITAFSSEDIENAGIQGLEDIAFLTPGMDFNGRSGIGRVDSEILLRGVSQGSADHLQATSVFIDGVYVLGTANVLGLQDLERVEVIKGPQSAFFGRNTFAGAINYITKTPNLYEFQSKVDVSFATHDKYDGSILTSGPILPGKLAYQVNARLYHQGGQWPATDGGTLGKESTKSISAVLYSEPVDNLSIKLRYQYQEDDDGPPEGGLLRGRIDDTCSGTSIERFDAEGNRATFFPTEYFCGSIPGFGYVEPGTGRPVLSNNTSLHPPILFQNRVGIDVGTGQVLIGPQPNALIDFLGGSNASEYLGRTVPDVNKLGLKREQSRVALTADYEFDNGYSAAFVGGYNDMRLNRLYDYDTLDSEFYGGEFVGPSWYTASPKYAIDWSVEARIISPQDNRFRWLVGATYYYQDFKSGSKFITTCFIACSTGPVILTLPPTGGNVAKVWGIFGSVSYDITDKLTIDVESRYLEDERTVQASGLTFSDKYKDYTPRVILTYKPTEQSTLYAQVSRGILPGTTNAFVATCSPDEFLVPFVSAINGELSTASECDQMRAQMGENNFKPATDSQELEAIEIGWKQILFDGRLNLNLTWWHYKWTNRPFPINLVVTRDAQNPADRDGIPLDFPNNFTQNAMGSQKLDGLEFESNIFFTRNWQAQFNVSWSENKFTEFSDLYFKRVTGVTNYKGLTYQGYPEWMGNLSTTYTGQLASDWEWYSRVDLLYHGDYYAENLNLAKAPDYLLTNLRAGVVRDNLRVELFVRNLFDIDEWRNVVTRSDFSTLFLDFTSFRAILVQPQEKRTVGFRLSMNF